MSKIIYNLWSSQVQERYSCYLWYDCDDGDEISDREAMDPLCKFCFNFQLTLKKKRSARKSFAPLLNVHPLKAIISSKCSPLLVVFQLFEVSKSLKVRQKRGAWAMYNYIHVIIHGRHVYADKQKM